MARTTKQVIAPPVRRKKARETLQDIPPPWKAPATMQTLSELVTEALNLAKQEAAMWAFTQMSDNRTGSLSLRNFPVPSKGDEFLCFDQDKRIYSIQRVDTIITSQCLADSVHSLREGVLLTRRLGGAGLSMQHSQFAAKLISRYMEIAKQMQEGASALGQYPETVRSGIIQLLANWAEKELEEQNRAGRAYPAECGEGCP